MSTVQETSAPRTFAELAEFAATAGEYRRLRLKHPEVPARLVHMYTRDAGSRRFEEFVCEVTRGHTWSYTGSAYGGDDESYHGEGRCYCSNCGADGDA